jgi:predicted DNA-binding protein (MmcQ/YjbR family)
VASERLRQHHQALYERARDKPGAVEDHPWGDVVFKIRGKIFAFVGSPESPGVTVKVDPDELDALLSLPFVRRASYIGRYGWISVAVTNKETRDLALGLIDDSYDVIAAKTKGGGRGASA